MERWSGKIAVVTGASAGIGAAVVQSLLRADVIVIGLARRVERIEELRKTLTKESHRSNLHAFQCDVADPQSIKQAFAWIEKNFEVVNILINNAGINEKTMILSTNDNHAALDSVIDTNLRGLIHCTKAAYKLMAGEIGHIVNVNSVLGHKVLAMGSAPMTNVYSATKFGVTATTEVLRQELNYLKNTRVKVSSISPGFVKTEIVAASGYDDADEIFKRHPHLLPENIADAIMFVLGTPANVQIHELVIKPVGEMA